MHYYIKITIFILALLHSSTTKVFGQTTTKEITDKFFTIYSKEPIKAIEYAFSTNKWFDRNQDAVINLKSKLKELTALCSNYYGYEALTEKTAGSSVKIATFVVKYDREPIRFTFIFYKAKDNWMVNNFSFDEDIDEDLKAAVRPGKLKESDD